MKNIINNIIDFVFRPYKIEVFLGLVATAFFFYFVLYEIMCYGWESPALRSMTFTLFGIVGLIGLSIGIRRNELMKNQLNDAQFIERANSYIKDLSSEDFHIVKTALTSLERFHNLREFPDIEKQRIREALAYFIHSDIFDTSALNTASSEYVLAVARKTRDLNHRKEVAQCLYRILNQAEEDIAHIFIKLKLVNELDGDGIPSHFEDISLGSNNLDKIITNYLGTHH